MIRFILTFILLLTFLLNINGATVTWIGGTGDWDEAFNWDTGMLPTISDDVTIVSSGVVTIPANYSALTRNLVISGDLNIETGANLSVSLISGSVPVCDCGIEVNVSGELTVNGNLTISTSIGTSTFRVIHNKGTINNNGSIIIDGSKGIGLYSSFYASFNNNSGSMLNISNTEDSAIFHTSSSPLINQATASIVINMMAALTLSNGIKIQGNYELDNSGTIDINDMITEGKGISNSGRLKNRSGGVINIKNINGTGLYTPTGTFYNFSGAFFNVKGTVGTGIILGDSLINYDNATISVDSTAGVGMSTITSTYINNMGNISITNNLQGGIYSDGLTFAGTSFTNQSNGVIIIDRVEGQGRGFICSGNDFKNYGIIDIKNIESSFYSGLYNGTGDTLTNESSGQILIDDCEENGFDNLGVFINNGKISFGSNIIGDNLFNDSYSTVTNAACGIININGSVYNRNNFFNSGWLKINFNGSHTFTTFGMLSNGGVIEDIYDSLDGISGINNNGVFIRPINTYPCSGVPINNALSLGNLAGFTVNGWFTDEVATISAGSFDAITNTFTPNAVGEGITTMYVKITDDSESCDEVFEIRFSGNAQIWFSDNDADGFGNPAVSIQSCTQPTDYVSDNTDCNDNDVNEFPGQIWYKDQDNDQHSDGTSVTNCTRPTGYRTAGELVATSGDCDDTNPSVNPAAPEICDAIDNDCNSQIDEGSICPGSVCSNAISIVSFPYNYSGSTLYLGDDYEFGDGCSSNYIGGNDAVFTYTPSANEVLRFRLKNTSTLTNYAHAIFIMDGCPDIPSTNCIYSEEAGATSINNDIFIPTAELVSGTTYYIIISSHPSYHQDFDFELTIVQPVGNICGNADVINSLPYSTSKSTTLAGDDYEFGDGCNSNYIGGNDYVFEYTPSTNQVARFQLNNTSTSANYAHAIFVMDGCPDDPSTNCVYSENAGASATNTPVYIETAVLQSNTTYYIVVASHPSYHQDFDFNLSVSLPTGNICENAEIINSLPFIATNQTTYLAGDDYEFGDGCNSNYIGANDYVYSFTPSSNTSIDITLGNLSDTQTGIFLLDGCPSGSSTTCISEVNTSSNNYTMFNQSVMSGVTYYIVISSHSSYTAYFDYDIEVIQASALPVELLNFEVKEKSNQDVLLNWVTANEIDFHNFEIERKREDEHWETIGSTLAKGDGTAQTKLYEWTDDNAKNQTSSPRNYFYYRLKMMDLDGTFEYSSIVSVLLEKETIGEPPFKIFPNPTIANRNIFIQRIASGGDEEYLLIINDQLGREVYRQEVDFSQNSILEIPNQQLLSHGLYIVQIKNKRKILQTDRLIILID